MRSFKIIILIIFFLSTFFIYRGSAKNLKVLFKKHVVPSSIFPVVNTALFVLLFILYIFPLNVRKVHNYQIYYLFNSIFFAFLLFSALQSLAWTFQLIFKNKFTSSVISWSGFIIGISLAASVLFGTFAGNRQITVKRYELQFNNLPGLFDNYKIVHISDLHLGGFVNKNLLVRTCEKIAEIKPDIIVFTGDLVNNYADETDKYIPLLKRISDVAETFSILGNHDYGDYSNWDSNEEKSLNFEKILTAHKNAGFQLLKNEHTILIRGSDSIYLAGVENWGHPPFPQYANTELAVKGIPEDAFTIMLTHDPAHWETLIAENHDIDLTLSGHTHGMQWGIKLAGISFSPAMFTRQNWGGIYKNNKSVLHVNTGLGNVFFPWRLDMSGEITVITLKRSQVN